MIPILILSISIVPILLLPLLLIPIDEMLNKSGSNKQMFAACLISKRNR